MFSTLPATGARPMIRSVDVINPTVSIDDISVKLSKSAINVLIWGFRTIGGAPAGTRCGFQARIPLKLNRPAISSSGAGYNSKDSQITRGTEKLYNEIVAQSTNDEIFKGSR